MRARAILLSSLCLGLPGLLVGCDSNVQNGPNDPACPQSDPSAGDACDSDGLECSYDHDPNEECVYAYECSEGAWAFTDKTGGGCEEEQCLAYPTCSPGEEEVESCEGIDQSELDCHSSTMCGSTIYCVMLACENNAPTCDEGDSFANGECPPDASCYEGDDGCGGPITCIDTALPHHCPSVEPTEGTACEELGQTCDYDIDSFCWSSYTCDEGVWISSGEFCEEDP